MAINLLFACSKFVFNPFLFSIFLYLILIPSRKKDIQLLPLCGSLIFGYQWGLLVIIIVQIFTGSSSTGTDRIFKAKLV